MPIRISGDKAQQQQPNGGFMNKVMYLIRNNKAAFTVAAIGDFIIVILILKIVYDSTCR